MPPLFKEFLKNHQYTDIVTKIENTENNAQSQANNNSFNKNELTSEEIAKFEVKVIRIEDGFIRSNGLGSRFYYPYSLVFDDLGIYFDPTRASRLEEILNNIKQQPNYNELISQAQELIQYISRYNITKYSQGKSSFTKTNLSEDFNNDVGTLVNQNNNEKSSQTNFLQESFLKKLPNLKPQQKIIFVPGQVDTDASIIQGGYGYNSLKLLQEARAINKDGYIIFKIHPDVLFSGREGETNLKKLYELADYVCSDNTPILDFINISSEVHTITSLTGFDALIRGKTVYTYGMPFYAGWGLTNDKQHCSRRKAQLNLNELVAAAIILYPRYFNWDTMQESNAIDVSKTLLNTPDSKHNKLLQLTSYYFKFMKKLGLCK